MESPGDLPVPMLGLQQYLSDLNNVALDSQKVALDELANIRAHFAADTPLEAYARRKYVWKLVVSRFFLHEDFVNPQSPLGLRQTLECLQTDSHLDKECAWNAINVIYAPIMNAAHWQTVLETVVRDLRAASESIAAYDAAVVRADLTGLTLNAYFIPHALGPLAELEDAIYGLVLEHTLYSELSREALVLLGELLPRRTAKLATEDVHALIDTILSFIKTEPIAVFNVLSVLAMSHGPELGSYVGQLLEFYSYLSNGFIKGAAASDSIADSGDPPLGDSNAWAIPPLLVLLAKLAAHGFLVPQGDTQGDTRQDTQRAGPNSAYRELALKITHANLSTVPAKLNGAHSKDVKMLLGSLYINSHKLLMALGETDAAAGLLAGLETGLNTGNSFFSDNAFKVELINTVTRAFDPGAHPPLTKDHVYQVLKYGKLLKRLLHTKNVQVCEAIQQLLLRLSEFPLNFSNAKIILVVLFDKFIRVEQKSTLLELILKVMQNLLSSGVVRYSIFKLIKCWISLGEQGDDYWLVALELISYCVSNSESGIENGTLALAQSKSVDADTHQLREQIIDFVYLGLLSIPDNKVASHTSFFLLSLSILKLNAQYWLIGDIGKQINAMITKYPAAPPSVKTCIVQTFVDYYPLVHSKYKTAIFNLLQTLSAKDENDSSLVKSSQLCFAVLNGELRVLKYDQGILIDLDTLKITYRVKEENGVVMATFSCISKEPLGDAFDLAIASPEDTSKWELSNRIVDRGDPNKAKFEFHLKINALYPIQDEPVLNITSQKGTFPLRIGILLKPIHQGAQMTVQSFEQRWAQVFSAMGDSCYDSRSIVVDNANLLPVQRIFQRMGFGIVAMDSTLILAVGLLKFNSSSLAVLVKLKDTGELEVVSTQANISSVISPRLEMAICNELSN